MLSYDEALGIVLEKTGLLPIEQVPLNDCLGLFTAEVVTADFDMPRFDNSAMDGFAVRAADVADASPDHPVRLPVIGTVQAGDQTFPDVAEGLAVKIMTGAPVPEGLNAVIIKEDCEETDGFVSIRRGGTAGDNIRRRGEEFTKGQAVIAAGTRITPPVVGLLASLGNASVAVHRRPRVGIVGTGNELTDPGKPLLAGGLYDSNSFALSAAVRAEGAEVTKVLRARDDMAEVFSALKSAAEGTDVVIAVGGISVGEYDLVKQALSDLGVQEQFWGVAMKPGKPLFFGTRGTQIFFGLPGNPVSALVCFDLFSQAALCKMIGAEPEPRWIEAKLDADIRKKSGRLEFVRGYAETVGGEIVVWPTTGQESHMLGGLASANCLIQFPCESEVLARGEQVRIHILEWS